MNNLEELSKFTIISKYSKYLPELKRRETWEEITNRSLEMHLKKFSFLPQEDKNKIKEAFELVKAKKVLPSMRSAQFAGTAIETKNERMFNCCFLHVHNTRCIEKAFYLLLCGVGAGFGLTKKYVTKFPRVHKTKIFSQVYIIPDSIEGWAQSTKALIDSYLEGNVYTGVKLIFDYSLIRPKGAPLSHGGQAPGPSGLRLAHQKITGLLETLPIDSLRTIDVYDILMHIADAVLSGGIRRAATIALFQKDDELMMNAKVGNWFETNPQRARSNNTVLLLRNEVTQEDFNYIIERTKQFGEPGFAFVDDMDAGLNPCAEIGFLPIYEDTPAVQMCNLVTINGNKVTDKLDFFKYAEAASLIATLQAAYTDFKFLDEADKKLTEEEALLGVSILGYFSLPGVLLHDHYLRQGAKIATDTNELWAAKLGINKAARVTCTKPDGNSSCVLESPFSGIHPAHANYYYRRVQVNRQDPIYQHFKKSNPSFCEKSVYSINDTDDVIIFPIKIERGDTKETIRGIKHLELIKRAQENWVRAGERNNNKPVSHSISCTVIVDDWALIANYLFNNKNAFTAVSLLSDTGETDYAQAPYETITEDMYIELNPVDYSTLTEEQDNTTRNQEIACAGGLCSL